MSLFPPIQNHTRYSPNKNGKVELKNKYKFYRNYKIKKAKLVTQRRKLSFYDNENISRSLGYRCPSTNE